MSSTYPTSTSPPAGAALDAAARDVAALFAAYHERVFRAAFRVTGNAQDAEDVLQGVFLKLVRQPEAFPPLDQPGAYLQRAAINAALDVVRAHGRRKVIPLDGASATHLAANSDAPGGPDAGEREALRRALGQLNPRAAEMFLLHHFEGYNNQEIADLFGTTANVVGVTLFRARGQLKAALALLLGKDLT